MTELLKVVTMISVIGSRHKKSGYRPLTPVYNLENANFNVVP